MKEDREIIDIGFGDATDYETIIAAIPGGVLVTSWDDRFSICYANDGYYQMVGYDRNEYESRFLHSAMKAIHPFDIKRVIEQGKKQLEQSGSFSVRGRLCHKTRGYIWANFSGRLGQSKAGQGLIYMVIVDVSEHLSTLKKLQEEKTFNELIAGLSEEYFFDCDLVEGTMRFSKSFAYKLGFDEVYDDYRRAFEKLGLFEEGASLGFSTGELELLREGMEKELRFTLDNGEELWFLCRSSVIEDQGGKSVRIVGKLIDITRHKVRIDELSVLALRDPLTGLFNKTATENRIKETLKMRRLHDDNCALMIVDIDNFKHINDRLGHLYGDVVLTQLAENLRSLFREDDVVGRIGGDEFFVFLKSYRSREVLRKKASAICSMFNKVYSEEDTFVEISASIGIATCPEHGTDFDSLYKKADTALYEAKWAGKNKFDFYSPSFNHCYIAERTEIDGQSLKKSFKDNRIEYVFRLLYDSESPVTSIQSVLQLITESYSFSRGYIFESSEDGRTMSKSFEWCDSGVEISSVQNVPMERFDFANRAFLDEGMFILQRADSLPENERALLVSQGVLSMFLFGIFDMGKLVGFIGFDDCVNERVLDTEQVEEISTVCHVLATFLQKHRGNEKKLLHHETLKMVTEGLMRYVHVVDLEKYVILYENENLIEAAGKSSVGEICYKAYNNRDMPCENCPKPMFRKDNKHTVINTEHKMLGEVMEAEIRCIDWMEDKKVVILVEKPTGRV